MARPPVAGFALDHLPRRLLRWPWSSPTPSTRHGIDGEADRAELGSDTIVRNTARFTALCRRNASSPSNVIAGPTDEAQHSARQADAGAHRAKPARRWTASNSFEHARGAALRH